MTYSYNPNMYTGSLSKGAVAAAVAYAQAEFPLEACGVISKESFIPFENRADELGEDPANTFYISDKRWYEMLANEEIDCLVHSHNDFNKASLLDQEQQQALCLPSLIINLKHRSLMDCILFGQKECAPLHGRPFFYGAFDCLSLVRDFWLVGGVDLPNPPHDWEFWARAENPIEHMLATNKDIPFKEVPVTSLQVGDVLLYNMFGTKFINHMAVVSSDSGLVLHHMYNNVSGEYPVSYGRKYLRKVVRRL